MKCYDPEGNEHMKEPIDARECIEHCGFTLEPPEKEVPKIEEIPEATPETSPDSEQMTHRERAGKPKKR